ncbi:MAG: aminoglycoside phosphotransferase family protein [Chloroflexota bacterium]|nr:aminoglycoside phosphotransferase family protein [Chloroflexota bacterium]
MDEYLAATETVIASGPFDASLRDALRAAMHTLANLPDIGRSWLAHGDFDAKHICADPDSHTYTGIIDFGEIRGADPLYDLGHLSVHAADAFGTDVCEPVLTGYQERVDLPGDWLGEIHLQTVAITTRALAIQLGRPESAYRRALIDRLHPLLDAFFSDG